MLWCSAQVEAADGGPQYCFLVSQIGNDARVAVQMADAKARDSRLTSSIYRIKGGWFKAEGTRGSNTPYDPLPRGSHNPFSFATLVLSFPVPSPLPLGRIALASRSLSISRRSSLGTSP